MKRRPRSALAGRSRSRPPRGCVGARADRPRERRARATKTSAPAGRAVAAQRRSRRARGRVLRQRHHAGAGTPMAEALPDGRRSAGRASDARRPTSCSVFSQRRAEVGRRCDRRRAAAICSRPRCASTPATTSRSATSSSSCGACGRSRAERRRATARAGRATAGAGRGRACRDGAINLDRCSHRSACSRSSRPCSSRSRHSRRPPPGGCRHRCARARRAGRPALAAARARTRPAALFGLAAAQPYLRRTTSARCARTRRRSSSSTSPARCSRSACATGPTRLARREGCRRSTCAARSPRCPPASRDSPTGRCRTSSRRATRALRIDAARGGALETPPPQQVEPRRHELDALARSDAPGFFPPGARPAHVRRPHGRREPAVLGREPSRRLRDALVVVQLWDPRRADLRRRASPSPSTGPTRPRRRCGRGSARVAGGRRFGRARELPRRCGGRRDWAASSPASEPRHVSSSRPTPRSRGSRSSLAVLARRPAPLRPAGPIAYDDERAEACDSCGDRPAPWCSAAARRRRARGRRPRATGRASAARRTTTATRR